MKPLGRRVAIVAACIAVGVVAIAGWLLRRELILWYYFAPLGRNAQGYLEYRHRQTGIVMVRLPGGTYWMGAQAKDPKGQNYDPDAKEDEGPVHEVTLSPFLLGKYEVTQLQWTAVMGSNPSEFKGDDDRPVENVSWDDIQPFLARTGLSLPTEAEWEYACRAETPTPFAGNLHDLAWYVNNSGRTTHPVGQKSPNNFGLFDMYGNVEEFCLDVCDDNFYRKPEATKLNPSVTSGWVLRRARGGSWFVKRVDCRSAFRDRGRVYPEFRDSIVGFRAAWRFP